MVIAAMERIARRPAGRRPRRAAAPARVAGLAACVALGACATRPDTAGTEPASYDPPGSTITVDRPVEDVPRRTIGFLDRQVWISNEVPGGRLNDVWLEGDSLYVAVVRPENAPINNSAWYAFKVWAAAPRTIRLRLTYEDGRHRYWPEVRRAGQRWSPLPAEAVDTTGPGATLRLDVGPDTLWVAGQELFTSADFRRWSDSLAALSFVSRERIGTSRRGRPIEMLTIGDPTARDHVLLISRQHPPEITGTIALLRFVQEIAADSPLSREFRDRFQVRVVPVVNPDGVDLGHWRHNLGGVDLNRDWVAFNQPETRAVRDALLRVKEDPAARIWFAADFHSTRRDVFYTLDEDLESSLPGFLDRWLAGIAARVPGYAIHESPSGLRTPTSRNWFYREFDRVASLTYEVGDDTDRALIREVAAAAARSMMELLLAEVPPRGAAAPAGSAPGATSPPASGASTSREAAAFPFAEWTIVEFQAAMEEGTLTSRELTAAYLERIAALDRRGPELRAMLDLNPDAVAIAAERDAERRAGVVRGPLHGIPVVLKDNIDTADRMTTTAGSLALEGSIADRDAFIVERLREAGAVLLGKANLSEWANFRSTSSSSGWSGRGGQVRNPYALDRSPCGSSSGSAVAVAANMTVVAVGTETDGSIVCPSATNGIVGIKPTIGLVSRSGIIPIAHSQDIAGPMGRTVADATTLLNALVGHDPRDPAAGGPVPEADYTRYLDRGALAGARIGVVRPRMTGYHAATDRVFERALDDLRAAGATVVDSLELPHHGEYGGAEWNILLYEFKHDLNAYLEGLGPDAPVRSLADVIAFNERERDRSMPWFGQEILEMAQEKGGLHEPEYLDALEKAKLAGRGIDSLVTLHRLDAVVAPTGSPAWTIDLVSGDHFLGASSQPAAVAGYPNITVPMGFIHGLPVGISFFGPAWSEPRLLALAYAYEQATGHRAPPELRPTATPFAPR